MMGQDGYRDIYLMIEKNQIKRKIDSAAMSRYFASSDNIRHDRIYWFICKIE